MNGSSYSILLVGETTEATSRIRDALRARSVQCSIVHPDAALGLLRSGDDMRHAAVVIDETSQNGRLPALYAALKSRNGTAPDVIILASGDPAQLNDLTPPGAAAVLPGSTSDAETLLCSIRHLMDRRSLSDALAQSEARYERLLQSVTDYTYTVHIENGRPVSSRHGPGCKAVTGYSPEDYAADPHLWYRMIHEADRSAVLQMSEQVCASRAPSPLEHRIIHKDGSIRWIKNTPVPRYDAQGRLVACDGLVTDITGRKQAEQELVRTNRALQALSQCGQAMVRTTSEAELLSSVCSIIIDPGGYRMCWVGTAEPDAEKRVEPAAWAGYEAGYLKTVFPSWSDGPSDDGPCGIAIRMQRPVVIRDIAAESAATFWGDAAINRGYGSLAALPLVADGSTFGMLAIYASEPGAFDEPEVKHLRDLADDLAFGISSLRAREAHRTAAIALRESEQKRRQEFLHLQRAKQEWEVTFDSISDPIFIHDRECRIIRANRAYQDAAGMPFNELIGKPFYKVFPRLDESVQHAWIDQDAHADRHPYYVEEFSVPSLRRIYRGRAYPVPDDEGNVLYCVQVLEDVTEMKQAEENMRQEMEISTNLLALAETATDTMDLDRLMERIVACCARIIGADAFLSYSWDSAGRTLRPGQHTPLPPGTVPMFRTDSPLAADAVRTALEARRPCAASLREPGDGTTERFQLDQPGRGDPPVVVPRPFPWLNDMETFLMIPLFGKTDCLGLLVGVFQQRRSFSDRDHRIAEGISREVSLALDEACLYRTALERSMELAHKMETLKVIHEIDRSILSTLQPQEILETAIRNIARIIPCDSAEAILTGPDQEILSRVEGNLSGRKIASPARMSRESTSAVDILTTSRPAYIPDLAESGALLPEEERLLQNGIRSLFRVPLTTRGIAVGVLSVASRRPASFTPENFATLEQLAGQIGVAFENTRLLADLQELLLGTVKSLSYAIDAKSSWTAGHSERVTRYALLLGRELGMAESALRDLELAGLLHDVGKLGTFDAILDKKTVLSREEFEIIKRHPTHGAEMLSPIKQMREIIPAVRHHHERFDGKGYPDGLRGEQIPDLARILTVADAFDSMTGWRPYRKTFDIVEAVEELRRCSGTQFDPVYADRFITMMQRSGLRTNA